MTAATAYYLRLVALRQSVLAPLLVFVGVLAMVYASDPGAPVSAATATSATLMPLSVWVMRLVAGAESQPFAEVTAVVLGGSTRRLAARCGAAVVLGALLTAVAVVWGRLAAAGHPYHATTYVVVAGMHLAQVLAGVGIGALLAPPLPATSGVAVVVTTAVVVLSLLVPWLPPLGPVLMGLDQPPVPGAGTVFLVVVQAALVGVMAVAVAAVLTRRRAA